MNLNKLFKTSIKSLLNIIWKTTGWQLINTQMISYTDTAVAFLITRLIRAVAMLEVCFYVFASHFSKSTTLLKKTFGFLTGLNPFFKAFFTVISNSSFETRKLGSIINNFPFGLSIDFISFKKIS